MTTREKGNPRKRQIVDDLGALLTKYGMSCAIYSAADLTVNTMTKLRKSLNGAAEIVFVPNKVLFYALSRHLNCDNFGATIKGPVILAFAHDVCLASSIGVQNAKLLGGKLTSCCVVINGNPHREMETLEIMSSCKNIDGLNRMIVEAIGSPLFQLDKLVEILSASQN